MSKRKKYVERCLWGYRETRALIERLRYELGKQASVRGHNYEAHVESLGCTDPVCEVTERVLELEGRILKALDRSEPVRKLEEDIASGSYKEGHVREIFRMRYLEHQRVEDVKYELHISSSTYWRGKERLLEIASKYFGLE